MPPSPLPLFQFAPLFQLLLVPGLFQVTAFSTDAYSAIPVRVSGGLVVPLRSHPPPKAAAPTRLVAAAMSAPVARAKSATKSAPAGLAAVRQLHSLRSPLGVSAAPISAR